METEIKELISFEIDSINKKAILSFDDKSVEIIDYKQYPNDDWFEVENVGQFNIYNYKRARKSGSLINGLDDESVLSKDGYACILYPYKDDLRYNFYHVKLIKECTTKKMLKSH